MHYGFGFDSIAGMNVVTLPKKEYQTIIRRQISIEKEIEVLRKIVQAEVEEAHIRPSILRRWERISRDLDRGKGKSFASLKDVRVWLENL